MFDAQKKRPGNARLDVAFTSSGAMYSWSLAAKSSKTHNPATSNISDSDAKVTPGIFSSQPRHRNVGMGQVFVTSPFHESVSLWCLGEASPGINVTPNEDPFLHAQDILLPSTNPALEIRHRLIWC